MARMNYLAAIAAAQRQALTEDPRVILMGEDVRANLYGTAPNFVKDFGPERVINLPISEAGFTGVAIGAAIAGLRPIVDYSYATFMYLGMDQLVNQAAKNRYMFGGQATIPVVFRASMWYGASSAAHHSDRPYGMFMNVPGLDIVVPSGAYDAKGLLTAAVRSNDPVLVFEDATLWSRKEEVPEEPYSIPLGQANVIAAGDDVTIVAIGGSVYLARQAVATLAERGISAELIDPRSLVPLDLDTLCRSAERTGRLLVVDPAPRTGGAAAQIATLVTEALFGELREPVLRLTAPDIHAPFSPSMERGLYPSRDEIIAAATALVQGRVRRSRRTAQPATTTDRGGLDVRTS